MDTLRLQLKTAQKKIHCHIEVNTMSKLIVEMEMPTCCDDCDANYDCCACGISRALWFHDPRYKEFDPSKERLPDCPIVGVLPDEHVDLIDRDKLKRAFCNHCDGDEPCSEPCVDIGLIETAPTVIAPERKDDEQIH